MFVRTLSLLLALVLVPATLVGQDKGKDKEKGKDKDKEAGPAFEYPLKVGTTWTYRVSENVYTLKITEKQNIGKQECARVEMSIGGKRVSWEHLAVARITADPKHEGTLALMRFAFEDKPATPPIPILLIPAGKKVWTINSKLDGKDLVGTFEKKVEEVKVPAGIYKNAIKVFSDKELKVNGVDMKIAYWFVSGVGMVKQQAELAGQKVIIELEKFTPGK